MSVAPAPESLIQTLASKQATIRPLATNNTLSLDNQLPAKNQDGQPST